ncbi:MAG: outer membrane protein assembly factor BamC [Rhodocyclaceae bacterium]|nr:outer membrane protein assembly factor BamC [Rhodocyclaceae bacterium]
MSRNLHASLSVISATVLLVGCSTANDLLESKKIDYKSASKSQVSSLEVPPDLTLPSRDERYTVPDVNPKGSATFSSYAADRTGKVQASGSNEILPAAGNIRVERDGNVRWLVVPMAPEKLWSQVKEFWQDSGFVINMELPEAGIMETDWAENRAKIPGGLIRDFLGKALDTFYSTSERDKFRTRMERGTTPGSTEIYISERSMREVFVSEGKEQTRWEPRASDPGMEAEMLRRLMVRLGVDETRSKTLLAATPQTERAALQKAPDGGGALQMNETFDRAWRRVGLVLDRVGFTVEDRDRTKGLYFVRYVDPEADNAKKDDKGFLSKLTFWKSGKDDKANKTQYRIYVKDGGQSGSSVQVLSAEGGVDNSESARKILGLLYQQLK